MPRPDRYPDDEDDVYGHDPRPVGQGGMSAVLVVGLVLGGLLVVGLVACGGIFMLARSAGPPPPPAGAVAVQEANVAALPVMRRVYTRQEFRGLVMGKTPDEVTAAVGKPDETAEDGDVVRWAYGGRVRDPGPGQPAATPVVVFREGKAAEVQY